MVNILVRAWAPILLLIAIALCLSSFELIAVDPVIMGILWGLLALSLLVYFIQTARTPPPPG